MSLGRVVGFVPFVGAGPGAGPNGFELTFHVAGLVVLNVSPVWVSCGWSVRPLPALCCVVLRWRPYRAECTGSLPTSEVKRRRARLVLGWGTAREDLRVLPALFPASFVSCRLCFLPALCPAGFVSCRLCFLAGFVSLPALFAAGFVCCRLSLPPTLFAAGSVKEQEKKGGRDRGRERERERERERGERETESQPEGRSPCFG